MINSINSNNNFNPQFRPPERKLTDEQKSNLESILSKYDSSNIKESDYESLFSEIKDAGIAPSKELRSKLEEAGFKVPDRPPEPLRGEKPGNRPNGIDNNRVDMYV